MTAYYIQGNRIIWLEDTMKRADREETRVHQAKIRIVIDAVEDTLHYFKGKIITTKMIGLITSLSVLPSQLKIYEQELEESLKYKPRKRRKKK